MQNETECAYVRLDVLVLEVEGVLPNVDADDRNVGDQRVLVGSGDDLKRLVGRRVALDRISARPSG